MATSPTPYPGPPARTSGLVAFVKRDCPTCTLVEPVLAELDQAGLLAAIYSQDDPSFPALGPTVDDTGLEQSYRNRIEVVPTLLMVAEGEETGRTVGWSREEWEALSGLADLGVGDGLPDYSPGCGSLSVDPDRLPLLEARFGDGLRSRRVEVAAAEDAIELMYDLGWSDGLPVVPPTAARVLRMLEGTTRSPGEFVALVPPNLEPATVEKVAINAVMAGCRPEYLPVVLAALETVCTDEFNMHGLLATTMPVGPVLLVNGPVRHTIDMNSGMNVLGQGNRANSTIGRALQLVVRNIGGGRPGGVDRAAHGSPAKIGLCFAEDEERSPWPSYAAEIGFEPGQSTVTAFPGEAPHLFFDQLTRDADGLARSFASALCALGHPKLVMNWDAMVVMGPEHAGRFAEAGWSKARVRDTILDHTERPADELLRGVGGVEEGLPHHLAGRVMPKFRPDGGLVVVHAGGGAGLFSAVIGGWVNGPRGSQYMTREIRP